jgi:hypothetical protein
VANKEALRILKQGPEAWNKWREATPGRANFRGAKLYLADLPRANFSGADFREADLFHANLCGANFNKADFTEASLKAMDLREADLRRANLTWTYIGRSAIQGANLQRANLRMANLLESNLSGADLRKADLRGANLKGANLSMADLTEAMVGNTVFVETDLSAAVGLERVVHVFPSSIGIDTIYRSQGKIPDSFLRGCGVPDNFIAYMRSLTGTAFDFYSCFISYSSKDQEFADRLYVDLQVKGVRCWLASEDLKIGDRFRSRIDESIRTHDKLLLVLSEHSIRSPWVEKEVETAFEREHREKGPVLFPIRLDDAVIETNEAWAADIRRTRHIGDFRDWHQHPTYRAAFEKLLRDLNSHDERTSR